MRLFRVGLLALMAMCGAVACHAQAAVYGEFTGAKLGGVNPPPWLYGPTVGLYYDYGHGPFAVGFDARGSFLHRGATSLSGTPSTLDLGLVGGRLALTPHILPIKPYVEALGGIGHLQVGGGIAKFTSTVSTYEFLGGVDFTFFPRLDWRVVEFGYEGLSVSGQTFSPKILSTGLVFRLP